MMKWQKTVGALAVTLIVSGCAGLTSEREVEALNTVSPGGTEFTRALAAEYRELANFEQFEMFDYHDAQRHARAGLAAAEGNVVIPATFDEYVIGPEFVGELRAARGRLMSALERGGRTQFPAEAAVAQTRFDCWMEQQEEGFQLDDIRACREEFRAAIAALEQKLAAANQPAPAPAAEPAPAPVPAPQRFLVFFGFDSSDIPASAASIIANAARAADSDGGAIVDIVGHADRSGSQAYNDALSVRRAEAVRQALEARGVSINRIVVTGRGENDPLVVTPDGVREPSNRRAEIRFR